MLYKEKDRFNFIFRMQWHSVSSVNLNSLGYADGNTLEAVLP